MLLFLASNLSAGLSLGSCAEHMKGKRAAGRVCCESVGGREPCCLPSLCYVACQGSIFAHMYVYMHMHMCVPVCQHPELLLQPSTMSSRYHQRLTMLCFKMQTCGGGQAAEGVQGSVALCFVASLT